MYSVRKWEGNSLGAIPESRFQEIIDDLRKADAEHPDVSLKHKSEWCLTYGRDGRLMYANMEGAPDAGRHMENVPVEKVVELWKKLARGELAAIEAEPWQPGW
mgnify:CR=1 FL=1